jgi:hypothetical protein
MDIQTDKKLDIAVPALWLNDIDDEMIWECDAQR